MHSRLATLTTLLRDGFILVFNQTKLDLVKTAQAVVDAGMNNMEVTCRIPHPLDAMKQLRTAMPNFVIGAASLVDSPAFVDRYAQHHGDDPIPSVADVVGAGVDYLVSAGGFRSATYERFADQLIIMPGCGTVSEIATQFSLGANLVKVFPASQLGGPGFVKAVDAPLHKLISLVPTGGTNKANILDYLTAGVLTVGGSFSAIDKSTLNDIINLQDYDRLADELRAIKALIDECRRAVWPDVDWASADADTLALATGRSFNL
jgi:2-dehydro-3-deoxyphosphogluconate aldolase/(4S)-4-hydroxy-2-oxoglutarate aldolase